ncbi:poly-gamma-glutamate hydrolase family protein [Rhizobium skierniewicense]|uniref:poly-gamma-glutamate hydrolase family protein n=1 Tax=Rhizobium skierniewicense TaxID=984260 RepID=UPI001572FF9B|nr:poly-gamma-glutamate hydrolase family protein [Rhizobium skierniewicense]
MDKYASFYDLAGTEVLDEDYEIESLDRQSEVTIVAPHGGWIEPGTTEIAKAIAHGDLSYYTFAGLRSGRPHEDLHVSSERFDEPTALALIATTQTVIGVHGMKNNAMGEDVWVGGRDVELSKAIVETLGASGFASILRRPGQSLAGHAATNVCNRGKRRVGVQLEISRQLRDRLVAEPDLLTLFVRAVRGVITP